MNAGSSKGQDLTSSEVSGSFAIDFKWVQGFTQNV